MEVSITCVVLMLFSFIQISSSACRLASVPSTDGTLPTKCEFGNTALSLGAVYTDYKNCEEYSCSKTGLMIICGIGIYAEGVHSPPKGCAIVKGEKCAVKYVDSSDHSIECQNKIVG